MRISIHPPRAGRDHTRHPQQSDQKISIHPPRAGRDVGINDMTKEICDISIHPPRAGRDEAVVPTQLMAEVFQSTRPVRGGTFKRLLSARA